MRLSHWLPPARPLSNAEVELGQKFHLPAVNQVNTDPTATLPRPASRHGEHSLAGMSLSFDGKVVLVTGAGGGKNKHAKIINRWQGVIAVYKKAINPSAASVTSTLHRNVTISVNP